MARWRPEMGHMQHHSEIWATCQAVSIGNMGAIALLDVFNLITLFPIVVQTFSEAIAIVETFIGSRTYKPTKSQQVFSWSRFCEVRSSNATHLLLTICLVGLAWLCHMGVVMFQHVPAVTVSLSKHMVLTPDTRAKADIDSNLLCDGQKFPLGGNIDWPNLSTRRKQLWYSWSNILILNNCQPLSCCAEGEIGKNVCNKRHQTEHQPKPQYNPIQSQHCDEHQLKRSHMQIPANGIRMKNNTRAYQSIFSGSHHWQRPSAKLKCPLLWALIPAAFRTYRVRRRQVPLLLLKLVVLWDPWQSYANICKPSDSKLLLIRHRRCQKGCTSLSSKSEDWSHRRPSWRNRPESRTAGHAEKSPARKNQRPWKVLTAPPSSSLTNRWFSQGWLWKIKISAHSRINLDQVQFHPGFWICQNHLKLVMQAHKLTALHTDFHLQTILSSSRGKDLHPRTLMDQLRRRSLKVPTWAQGLKPGATESGSIATGVNWVIGHSHILSCDWCPNKLEQHESEMVPIVVTSVGAASCTNPF